MILGHVKCDQGQKALELFQQMQQEGVWPNSVTFVGVLDAFATMVAFEKSRYVHQQVIQSDLESDVFAQAVAWLTCMQKCGSIEEA